jgi:hypothetical protein
MAQPLKSKRAIDGIAVASAPVEGETGASAEGHTCYLHFVFTDTLAVQIWAENG